MSREVFRRETCYECAYRVRVADKETAHHKVEYQTSTEYCAKDPPRGFTKVTKCEKCGLTTTEVVVRFLKVSEVPAACGYWRESEKACCERLEQERRLEQESRKVE